MRLSCHHCSEATTKPTEVHSNQVKSDKHFQNEKEEGNFLAFLGVVPFLAWDFRGVSAERERETKKSKWKKEMKR